MRIKVTFKHESYEGKQSNCARNINTVNFVPKDVQGILSSHKISEKHNEQEVFQEKAVIKNFAKFTEKTPVLESLFY